MSQIKFIFPTRLLHPSVPFLDAGHGPLWNLSQKPLILSPFSLTPQQTLFSVCLHWPSVCLLSDLTAANLAQRPPHLLPG